MVEYWKYYKYYFRTLWKKPLFWVMFSLLIFARYEDTLWIQFLSYVIFALLIPLSFTCDRMSRTYEVEDSEEESQKDNKIEEQFKIEDI